MYVGLILLCSVVLFFFFKQKTAYEMRISDWSSDVCSSDLLDRNAVLGDRGQIAQRREAGAALLRNLELGVERILHRLRRTDVQLPRRGIEQQQVALADRRAHVAAAADHRHPHPPRAAADAGGQRPFPEHAALPAAAVTTARQTGRDKLSQVAEVAAGAQQH